LIGFGLIFRLSEEAVPLPCLSPSPQALLQIAVSRPPFKLSPTQDKKPIRVCVP
jgi:hypothetical protein